MKLLDETQVEAFDTEFVDDCRWPLIEQYIEQTFGSESFSFLDIGGGNGTFTDRILERFPLAQATVLDSSAHLISKNQLNPRKKCICDSVENLKNINEKFDLVSMNWLLHHLVSDTYAQTRVNQIMTLKAIHNLLTPRGKLSIFENIYHGWIWRQLPGRLIFFLTSLKSISFITRRLGANTAGVGVCFLTKSEWISSIENADLKVLKYNEPDDWSWEIQLIWKLFLHVKERRIGHFWIGPK